jgi:VWFA-related protein
MKQFHRAAVLGGLLITASTLGGQQPEEPLRGGGFRFRSGVELINVTATVSDSEGRFVAGLKMEDFVVYDDDERQTITHFEAERVPVSLGIVLDTSGSMEGEKIRAARSALDRLLFDLLGKDDDVFLYTFSDRPYLVERWTNDRRRLSDALHRTIPKSGTAMYDAVAAAVPLAETGRHRKKVLLIISDGNDSSSHTSTVQLDRILSESEVVVYAIGIDADELLIRRTPLTLPGQPGLIPPPRRQGPIPGPKPVRPGGGRRLPQQEFQSQIQDPSGDPPGSSRNDYRINVAALRDMTDDSGGRTEVIRDARDLAAATVGIANELSQQYFLGYPSPSHNDKEWHTIRVEVPETTYRVRSRRGYVAG